MRFCSTRRVPKLNLIALIFACALACAHSATSASAQNLLVNGEFDVDFAPWTIGSQEFIEIAWRSADVDGSLSSGSLETYSQLGGPYQCVPVSGNSAYFLDAFVAPLSLDRQGTVDHSISVEWFSGTNCAFGTSLSTESLPPATTLDVFERLSDTLVAPLSANSARVRLVATLPAGFGFARALYDSVYLPEPSFGTGLGLGVFAMAGLRRRGRPPVRSASTSSGAC